MPYGTNAHICSLKDCEANTKQSSEALRGVVGGVSGSGVSGIMIQSTVNVWVSSGGVTGAFVMITGVACRGERARAGGGGAILVGGQGERNDLCINSETFVQNKFRSFSNSITKLPSISYFEACNISSK